jgi:hypothetical protein
MIRDFAMSLWVAAVGGLPITPCMLIRSGCSNRTVALSRDRNTDVSECGHSDFGTVIISASSRATLTDVIIRESG